jgi:hypothetical protein
MRARFSTVLCLGLFTAFQANAAEFFDPKILGGVSIGRLDLEDEVVFSENFDGHSTAWSIFVGLEINRYLSVETGWVRGGEASQERLIGAPTVLAPLAPYETITEEIESSAWLASVIGSLPLTDEVSVFARGGFTRWKAEARETYKVEAIHPTTGSVLPPVYFYDQLRDETGNDPYYGIGIAVNIDSGLLRLEYDLSTIDEADARWITLAMAWKFKPW